MQLGQLQKIAKDLQGLGFRIVAVSPDRPEKLKASKDKNELGYVLLSDSTMAAAKAFGIAFRLDDEAIEKYKTFGIDLEAASGEKHHLLPVPSVFLVDDGVIEFTYADPNYRRRVDPDVLLAAARSVANK